ncbi:MAG: serine/threonine-protein kinase [Pyrinomonadaceae bacterium]
MLTNGQKLDGRYVIREEIGSGGFGAVYLAEDTRFSGNNRVAVKKIVSANEQGDKAFRQEADLLYNLTHQNLPKVTNCFHEDGANFIVMDYISGEDLAEQLKRGVYFSLETVLDIADKVLDALEYLHSFLIFHRDIKPHNIKIDKAGRVFLLDFGTAKGSIDETPLTKRTGGQSVTGFTPFYAPLEQILRVDTNSFLLLQSTDSPFLERFLDNKTDARSDIYSLGATLYHLLTGYSPEKATATVRAHAIWSGKPEPLPPCQTLNPEIPDALAAIVERCMEILPENRFQTAGEMRRALEALEIPDSPSATRDVALPTTTQDVEAPSITHDKTVPLRPEHIPIQKPENVRIPVDDSTELLDQRAEEFGRVKSQPVEETVSFADLPTDELEPAGEDREAEPAKTEAASFTEPLDSIYPPQPPPVTGGGSIAKPLFAAALAFVFLAVMGLGGWLVWKNWPTDPVVSNNTPGKGGENPNPVGTDKPGGDKSPEMEPPAPGSGRSMDYSLLVQKMRNGQKYQEPFESSGQEIFETGYQFQMRFTPPGEGYLYIFAEGLDDKGEKIYNILFPTPVRNDGRAEVKGETRYETGWNEFGGQAGTENFWMIWTAEKLDFLEKSRDDAFESDTGQLTDPDLLNRLKSYLEEERNKKTEASKETEKKLTKVNFQGDSAVYLIELEHR